METIELQPEINSLRNQLLSLTEKFDDALTNNVEVLSNEKSDNT